MAGLQSSRNCFVRDHSELPGTFLSKIERPPSERTQGAAPTQHSDAKIEDDLHGLRTVPEGVLTADCAATCFVNGSTETKQDTSCSNTIRNCIANQLLLNADFTGGYCPYQFICSRKISIQQEEAIFIIADHTDLVQDITNVGLFLDLSLHEPS